MLYQLSYDPSREARATRVANGSPCAACGVRTIGRTSGTRSRSGRVPPALDGLVVPTLAFLASHRHCDALACRHRWQPPVRGRATCRVPHALRPSRGSGRGSQTVWRPARRRRAAGDCAATASARAAARSRPAAARWRSSPVSTEIGVDAERLGRRRYSVTSGGRALRVGRPGRADALAEGLHLGHGAGSAARITRDRRRRPGQQQHLAGRRRRPRAGSGGRGGRARTPPGGRRRRGRRRWRGRGRAGAPRCARRAPSSPRARLARAPAFNQGSSGGGGTYMWLRDRPRGPRLNPRGHGRRPGVVYSARGWRMVRLVPARGPHRAGCSRASCAGAPRSTPTATTCACGEGPWRSYGEVNARANRVANALIARGLAPRRGGLHAAAELRGEPRGLVRHPEGGRRPVPDQPGLPRRLPVVGDQPAALALPGDRRHPPRARWTRWPASCRTWSA